MILTLILSITILPGTVLVLIPSSILYLSQNTEYAMEFATVSQAIFWAGSLAGLTGLCVSLWTVSLFVKVGQGTPAPWSPPLKLVVCGPYRHVRNPMITSVLFMLLAEALLLQSSLIAGWMVLFFLVNSVYFLLFEEKSLRKKFGNDYFEYSKNVPRWIPRLRPWHQPDKD